LQSPVNWPHLVTSGLVTFWDMGGGQSGQAVPDIAGGGNVLQLGSTSGPDVNDPTWSAAGLVFDGAKSYCKMAANPFQFGTGSFSVAVLCNISNVSADSLIFDNKSSGTNLAGFNWNQDPNNVTFRIADGTHQALAGSQTVAAGVWYVLTGVVDRTAQPDIFLPERDYQHHGIDCRGWKREHLDRFVGRPVGRRKLLFPWHDWCHAVLQSRAHTRRRSLQPPLPERPVVRPRRQYLIQCQLLQEEPHRA